MRWTGEMSVSDSEKFFEAVEKISDGIMQLGSAAAWIGHEGDGIHMGAFEAHTERTEAAIQGAGSAIAEAVRDGLYEVAKAIRGEGMTR